MIDRNRLKDRYDQFKRWQHEPVKYVNSDEEHRCMCCGNMYTGNFCPCCSQKSTVGRISWKSVRQGVMDIWGLGTRSLLYTIWQLLLRPGYLINDYINGKRQLSFPPVKMLFIVTVIYSLVVYWLFPHFFGLHIGVADDGSRKMMSEYYKWYETHFSWAMLLMSILAIIPTWVMFRYAPRNTRHTLPEGFFIQIYLSGLMVVLYFLLAPLGMFFSNIYQIIITLLTMMYYIIAYRQLFGYGFWGTFWRQSVILLVTALCASTLIIVFFNVDFNSFAKEKVTPQQAMLLSYVVSLVCLFIASVILAVGYCFNLLATRKDRKEMCLNSKRMSAKKQVD